MLSIGIVGLPNVGKSTIFNALVKNAQAVSSNYPFTTIEPNVGIVEVPDERLSKLAEIEKSARIVPAAIKFVDIAGLVKGASKGEGLGNKFLSHIKEVDAIAMVVRCFDDPHIIHVAGRIDPADDIKTIMLELLLADLEQVDKAIERNEREVKSGNKDALKKDVILQKMKTCLEAEKPIRDALDINENDYYLVNDVQLITTKPMFFIANVAESQLGISPEACGAPSDAIMVSAKTEADINELSDEDLVELGVETRHGVSLRGIISKGYEILDLISFLTAGPMESRAWPIPRGTYAPQAAGTIHGDFEKKFIAVDVVSYEKFVLANGWALSREKGFVRTEGKEYEMKDGDTVIFKHG